MKKIALLLVLVVLSTSAFAAVKKATPVVSSPAPVVASTSSSSSNLAIGAALGYSTLRYDFNKDISGQLGVAYASAGGTSTTGILVKVDYNLAKVGDVLPNIGLYYNSVSGGTSLSVIGVTGGVGLMVASNLLLGANMVFVNSTTAGGTSTTGILSGATLAAAYYL